MHFCPIHDLFHKDKIPTKLPEDMQRIVSRLKKIKSKERIVKEAYKILTRKYRGYRILTYLRFYNAFDGLDRLWGRRGFIQCHHFTYLMRILLVRSGKFKDSDVKLMVTTIWYSSPHQFLRIRIGRRKYIDVDMWGKVYGVKFGNYAHGFNQKIFINTKSKSK